MEFKNYDENFLTYSGPFNMRIISGIGKFLIDNIEAPDIAKIRAYRVFIELTQNVALYSAKRIALGNSSNTGEGYLSILVDKENIKLTTRNKILPEHKTVLFLNCSAINQVTEEQLKEKKHELRRGSSTTDSGAHIGLLTISLISRNSLQVNFERVDDSDYFTITATISLINNI